MARNQAPFKTRMEMPAHLAQMALSAGRKVEWMSKRPNEVIKLDAKPKRIVVNWEAVEYSIHQLERYNANQRLRRKRMSATEVRLNRYDRASEFLPKLAIAMAVCMPDMIGPTRVATIVRKRHVAMWIIRRRFKLSTLMVGQLFGGRDHATVVSGLKKVDRDDTLQAYADAILQKVDGGCDA